MSRLNKNAAVVPFESRERRKAKKRVDSLFRSEDKKKWDSFLSNASRKSFVKAINSDVRSDEKLTLHVDSMNRLLRGKKVATVSGDGGARYDIVKLKGKSRYGCTCNDWRYKRSVAPVTASEKEMDCKHIKKWKETQSMHKRASISPEVLHFFCQEVEKEASIREIPRRFRNQEIKKVTEVLNRPIPGTEGMHLFSKGFREGAARNVSRFGGLFKPKNAVEGGVLVAPGGTVLLPAKKLLTA